MTKIIFLEDAQKDLADIKSYYFETAPHVLENILSDIYLVFEVLSIWPLAGRVQRGAPGRRFVSPKFRFTITDDFRDDRVEIMGIFRFQDRTT